MARNNPGGQRDGNPGGRRDAGAVTVEAALGICSVVAVFAVSLGGLSVLVTHLRCTDAALEAARLIARGDRARAETAVTRIAPRGARLRMSVRGDEVTATVSVSALGGLVPGYEVSSSAFAVMEPGAVRGAAQARTAQARTGDAWFAPPRGIVEEGEVMRTGERTESEPS